VSDSVEAVQTEVVDPAAPPDLRPWLARRAKIGLAVALVVIGALGWRSCSAMDRRINDLHVSIEDLSARIDELESAQRATTAPTTTLLDLPIPDHDAEMVRVTDVVTRFLGLTADWANLVDEAVGVEGDVDVLKNAICGSDAQIRITGLGFATADRAVVNFNVLSVSNVPEDYRLSVDVVRSGDAWKISAESVRSLAEMARPFAQSCIDAGGPTTDEPR